MGLEQRTIEFNGQPLTRLLCRRVDSDNELKQLTQFRYGGNYFYGGAQDQSGELQVFFGQGPNHDIFKQFIQQETRDLKSPIDTCQISLLHEPLINNILFYYDPGVNSEYERNDEEKDRELIPRRIRRLRSVCDLLDTSICEPRVLVGWLFDKHGSEGLGVYSYIAQRKELILTDDWRRLPVDKR